MLDTSIQPTQKILDEISKEIPDDSKYGFMVDVEASEVDKDYIQRTKEYWEEEYRETNKICGILRAVHNLAEDYDDLSTIKKLARYCNKGSAKAQEINATALGLITKQVSTYHIDDILVAVHWARLEALRNYSVASDTLSSYQSAGYNFIDENIEFKKV